MNAEQLDKLLEDARVVVDIAVHFLKSEQRVFSNDVVEYKGFNDLVSYVDKTSEEILVNGLQKLIPDAGFITEEDTLTLKNRDYVWIIDPLDGTTNFVHGIPCYCVSVGLTYKQELILGIVHEVNLDECFYARKGGGAFLNEEKIKVSETPSLSKSLVATGFPYHDFKQMKEYMEVFDFCMKNSQGLRRLGSAAVDLAYVACGRFEVFYEYGLNPWDIAAGSLIVKEAGGHVSDFKNENNFLFGKEIIASNTAVHAEFQKVVAQSFQ
ncbi:MAG: inositol monophosphatase family protein [Bacteroidia bacterium]